MADTLDVLEAKQQFSKVLERAEHGVETVITRHGRPIAKVTPAEPMFDWEKVRRAGEALEALRAELKARGVRVTHAEIKEWINEGRP